MKHPISARALRSVSAFRMCAAVLAAAVLSAGPVTAHAAPAADGPSRAEVYTALGLDDQPADYAILVDTSWSMRKDGRYETVRSTLRPFLESLSPKDHVALVAFDTRPDPRYIGPADDTDEIMSKVPPGPTPEGATDIGAALETALTELERSDASEIASIVLVTDGSHQPGSGTRYPESTGEAWTALRKRATDIGKRTELAGYALPLGTGASGADLLDDVVPNTTVLRPDSVKGLGAYLQRAGDRTRARKAQLLLAKDQGKGVTAAWQDGDRLDLTDGSATARLTLRSTTSRLPLTVTGLKASVGDPAVALSGLPSQLTLKPGESRSFDVRLRGGLPDGMFPYRRTENAEGTLLVSGRVASPWEQALAPTVRLKVAERVRVPEPAVPLRDTVGSPVLLPAVIGAVLLIALIGWLLWRRTHRPRLRGELLLVPAFEDRIPDRIELRGRRMRLQPHSVGGRGQVHGRRRVADGESQVHLLIRYTPDGSSARESDATCRPGSHVVVNGVSFTYVPEQRGRDSVGSGHPR
ncbi:vWA domain-containing protein [Streptomyces sp. NPDC023998]|uniref:vWA domain-containing protein n=1 Tax=Streptomyces sp. NPDC023998 TaxID=3154597 RepID=UPI0033E8A206